MLRMVAAFAVLSGLMSTPSSSGAHTMQAVREAQPPVRPSPFAVVLQSPVVAQDGRVTFRISAPNASSVEVRGSFPNPYQPATVSLRKDDRGVWSGTSLPLPPEMYSYTFYVDGVAVLDPANSHSKRDGAIIANTFIIPGPTADLYTVKAVPHGTVSTIWYPSPRLAKTRRVIVYTPPGYESGSRRFPVLYLLHGGMGDEDSWLGNGRAPQILDNLIADGRIEPMIVVFPNVNASQTASQDYMEQFEPQGSFYNMDFPDSLVTDLLPFVDRTYRTRTISDARAVAGLSMGGAHALWAAFRHPGRFGWVESMSGGYMIIPGLGVTASISENPEIPPVYRLPSAIDSRKIPVALPALNAGEVARMRMLKLVAGERDPLLPQQRSFQKFFAANRIDAEVEEIPAYSHEWAFWRSELIKMLPRLFRAAKPSTKVSAGH